MWNRKVSRFLMIKITLENKIKIPVPMPLLLMDIVLDALEDLAFLADFFIPSGVRKQNRRVPVKSFQLLVQHFQNSYYEMRKFGKWQLFDIKAGKIRISADFV